MPTAINSGLDSAPSMWTSVVMALRLMVRSLVADEFRAPVDPSITKRPGPTSAIRSRDAPGTTRPPAVIAAVP
jgi:hypothetical protein